MDLNLPPIPTPEPTSVPYDSQPVMDGLGEAAAAPRVSLGPSSYLDWNPKQIEARLPSFLTPDEKAEVLLEGMTTQARIRRQHVDQIKDDVASQMIAQDQKRNQDHVDQLVQQLDEVSRTLNTPAPTMPTSTTLNPAEMWTAAIASLVSGNAPGVLNATYGLAGDRQKIEFTNLMRQHGLDQQQAERAYELIAQQLGQANATGARLDAAALENEQQLRNLRESARQFDINADLKTIDDERQDLRLRVDTFNKTAMQLWREGGEIPQEVATVLENSRNGLIKAGTDENLLMPIPVGKTVHAADVAHDNAAQDRRIKLDENQFNEKIREFDKSLDQKERQFAQNQARLTKQFEESVREFNVKAQSGYFTKQPKSLQSETDKLLKPANNAISNAQAHMDGINAQLITLEREIREAREAAAKATGIEKFKLQDKADGLAKKFDSLKLSFDNYDGIRQYWQDKKNSFLPDKETIRQRAKQLIGAGKVDENKVREKFKKDYGEDL